MSQALSSHDAEYSRVRPMRSEPRRSDSKTRRPKMRRPLARVPMLDWPAHLFDDNVAMADPLTEDFVLQFDMSAVSHGQEILAQVAA